MTFDRSLMMLPRYSHSLMGRMLDFFEADFNQNMNDFHVLKSDVIVSPTEYKYLFDMPGFQKENVDISYDDKFLYIQGERSHQEEQDDGKTYKKLSRSMGSFKEQIKLPEDIDVKSMNVKLNNGVMTIMIKRTESSRRQPVKIE